MLPLKTPPFDESALEVVQEEGHLEGVFGREVGEKHNIGLKGGQKHLSAASYSQSAITIRIKTHQILTDLSERC